MEIKKAACASCGAPLSIPGSSNDIVCNFCGASMMVERTGDQVALIYAKEVEKTIKETGFQTNAAIRESSQTTQLELKRIQIQQQIASLENQLSRIKSEIRGLESIKRNGKQKRQLKDLKDEKDSLLIRIKLLENEVYNTDSTGNTVPPRVNWDRVPKKNTFWSGCLTAFLIYILVGLVFVGIGMVIDSLIFGTAEGAPAPFSMIGAVIAIVAGVLGFIYKKSPNSSISLWIKSKFDGFFKKKPN